MNNDKCRMGRAQFAKPINHLPSLYQLTVLAVFIVPAAVNLAYAEAPELKMHVFDTSAPKAAVPNNDQGLNMIIFDESSKQTAAPVPVKEKTQAVKASSKPKPAENFDYWSASLSTGYQNDSLAWKTSSPAINEQWQSVDLWNIHADFGFHLPIGLVLKAQATYGFAFDGDLQRNSDFEVAANESLTSDYAMEFSGAVGYEFLLGNKYDHAVWGVLTPLVGYEYQKQRYTTANNTYASTWEGPWIGMDMTLGLFEVHELFANWGVHWADYEADGDRPLYTLNHNAKGNGYKADVGYRFRPSQAWAFSLAFKYQHWGTSAGTESLTLQSGNIQESVLSSVVRESFGVLAGVNVSF